MAMRARLGVRNTVLLPEQVNDTIPSCLARESEEEEEVSEATRMCVLKGRLVH